MSTLVFQTLRVGFPTADIHVTLNTFPAEVSDSIATAVRSVEPPVKTTNVRHTIHHEWIFGLVMDETEPFFICDTDLIFYRNFEEYYFQMPLAGYRIPEFVDDFSKAIARARLHPSLLYIDPVAVKKSMLAYQTRIPPSPFTPEANLFYPLCVPLKGKVYFYDTCSMLYHWMGGQPFTNEQKDAYCHFHFGTIEDLVWPRFPEIDSAAQINRRNQILHNPATGHGAWREQDEYFAKRHP